MKPMQTAWSRNAALAILMSTGLCGHVFGQTADELDTRALAATCANCHGTDGRPVAGSGNARLAGQSKDFIVSQMAAFRDGSRPATVMHQLAKGYSQAQIERIAAYFAAQK